MRYWSFILIGVLFYALSFQTGCEVFYSATGIGGSTNLIENIPEFQESKEYPKQLSGTITNSNFSVSITNTNLSLSNLTLVVTNIVWTKIVEHYKASENPDKFILTNPDVMQLWPGNLIQGRSLSAGYPEIIPITNRQPARISLALISGASNFILSRNVLDPSPRSVNQAITNIINGYNGGTAGLATLNYVDVYNSRQMAFELGLGFDMGIIEIDSMLGINWGVSKSRVIVKLIQQYFTVVYDDPSGINGIFNEKFQMSDLTPYIGNDNPPCYISSVTYGRVYIIQYESDYSLDELTFAVRIAWDLGIFSGSTSFGYHYLDILTNAKVTAFIMGEDKASGISGDHPENFQNYSAMSNILIGRSRFTSNNFGAPISYTVKYMKNAKLVRMNNMMEYDIIKWLAVTNIIHYKPLSKFNISINRLECLNQGETNSSSYTGSIEFYSYNDFGPFFTYTLPVSNLVSSSSIYLDTNFTTPYLSNVSDNCIRIKASLYKNEGTYWDRYYNGMDEIKYSYFNTNWIWFGRSNNVFDFKSAGGKVNQLKLYYSISNIL